jgi:2-polyprenyl-3-methyl-5-hydroxy-6-metoxy-1,4-benzoquinol methylase
MDTIEIKEEENNVEEINSDLDYLNSNWDVHAEYDISSHRLVIGQLLISGRKLIHGEVKRYVDLIAGKQTELNLRVNRSLKNILDLLKTRIAVVDNRINTVDNKISTVDNRINTVDNRIDSVDNRITQENSRLNIYMNEVVDRLDVLIQKPNDIYILAKKKINVQESNIDINTENKKQDDVFGELMESLDFRDKESNFKIQSKFINYFLGCERVLDIGCGKGDFLELCKINNIPAMGIDTSKKAIDTCLKRELNVQCIDVFKFLFNENENGFDGIFCSHLIEHFEPKDVAILFYGINKCIKVDGKLLIITPNVESYEAQTIHFWRDLSHVRFYQKDVIAKMLEFFGFEIIEAKFDEDTKGVKIFETKWVVKN